MPLHSQSADTSYAFCQVGAGHLSTLRFNTTVFAVPLSHSKYDELAAKSDWQGDWYGNDLWYGLGNKPGGPLSNYLQPAVEKRFANELAAYQRGPTSWPHSDYTDDGKLKMMTWCWTYKERTDAERERAVIIVPRQEYHEQSYEFDWSLADLPSKTLPVAHRTSPPQRVKQLALEVVPEDPADVRAREQAKTRARRAAALDARVNALHRAWEQKLQQNNLAMKRRIAQARAESAQRRAACKAGDRKACAHTTRQ